ncbi:IS1380 family transposase [Streptococcus pneumoniae]|nr:IS1380 family transposase [Streptococcus pneumoniae]
MIADDRVSDLKKDMQVSIDYYNGLHDIGGYRLFFFNNEGQIVEEKNRSNTKIAHQFFTELVDQKVQYLLSNPIEISTEDAELQKYLNEYIDEDFQLMLQELVEGASQKAIEYVFWKKGADNRISFKTADAFKIIPIYDAFYNIEQVIYYYDDEITIENKKKPVTKVQLWTKEEIFYFVQIDNKDPQLFTPNLKTIQNPCLSLDPGWFLFSPNGCFLLDKKEFPLYGISVEKNTKRKETHMNSLPNHHFQNKSFYQLSFDGGHLTQYGGLIFFQELFSQLKLKERISKYLVTNDQRRYCRYSDSDILVQFLFQLLTGYGTDYACKELSADAYFPKLLEGGQLASQPTLSRFLSRTDEETVHSLRCLNLELVEFFLQFHQLNQLIVDIDSTHFTTYGKQEGVAYNAHYRAHGYHPLYAFEGKTGYCFNAQLRPGNRYCSEEADSFITPVLERFNQLLFRMDSGFATPKLYDLIEKTGQCYLIKLKKNTVLSRLGDLSLPCPQDEDLTILPHSAYSETLYQAGSWSHKRRVCQFSERKEGNLFYDVISLVTNMTSGTSQDQFQLYRGRGQAENFIKEMKEGFFGDKTDSSTLIKNEVRMMMSCIAYNLYLFLKHLAGGDFQTLTIKRFRHLFLHVVGKCVRTGRKQLLKLSSLYAYSELFSALYSRIRKVNLNLPVPYEPPGRKASLMMH